MSPQSSAQETPRQFTERMLREAAVRLSKARLILRNNRRHDYVDIALRHTEFASEICAALESDVMTAR